MQLFFPQWKDTQLKRYYKFEEEEEDKLILTTEPINTSSIDGKGVLIWKRKIKSGDLFEI